eukprot:c45997_g1_i1 orf=2-208(-)
MEGSTLGLLRIVVSRACFDMNEVKERRAKYVKFETTIMGEEAFWKKAEVLVRILQPFFRVLHIINMEGK